MDGDCGGGGSSYAADGGSSYYPSVPANCDNRVPYSSECQPTHHHHVYGITDPAPGQYNASDNIVYMTETQLKHQGVRPGTQVVMVTAAQAQRACQCTAGWVLFGVGFVFPICWLVGVFLWLCTKNRHDKHAAIGSGVAIAVYAIFLGLFLGLYVVPLTMAAFRTVHDLGNDMVYPPGYYNNTWFNNPYYWNNPNNFGNSSTWNTTSLGSNTTSP